MQFIGWVIVLNHLQQMTISEGHNGMIPTQDVKRNTLYSVQPHTGNAGTSNPVMDSKHVTRVPTSFYQARYQPTLAGCRYVNQTANDVTGLASYNQYNGARFNPSYLQYYRSAAN